MKKIFSLLIVMLLLASVYAQDENLPPAPAQEQQQPAPFDYSTGNYGTLSADQWSTLDYSKIPPARVPDIPPQYLDFTKLNNDQMQKITSAQLTANNGANLYKSTNLGLLNPTEVNKAIAAIYPGIDMTVRSGVIISADNSASNNGVALTDLRQYPSGTKIEATADGWLINGVRRIGGSIKQVQYDKDTDTYTIDKVSTVTFTSKTLTTVMTTQDGTIAVDGPATGSLNVGGKLVSFTNNDGIFSLSQAKMQADNAAVTGVGFKFNGAGSINFNSNGDVTGASLDAFEGQQSDFTYKGTKVTTAGHTVNIYTDINSFKSSSGNSAFISDNAIASNGAIQLQRNDLKVTSKSASSQMTFQQNPDGTAVTTSKGIINIEDSNSIFRGQQDSTVMLKSTKPALNGNDADLYSVDGSDGNVAQISKKVRVVSSLLPNTPLSTVIGDTTLSTEITKSNGALSFSVNNAELQNFAKAMSSSTSLALINRELYINAGGGTAFAVNQDGMGRYEEQNGKLSTNIFSPSILHSDTGNKIVAVSQDDITQISKLVSMSSSTLKTIDVAELQSNPSLSTYIQRNLKIDLDKLQSAISNPDSQNSKDFFILIDTSKRQYDSGISDLNDATKITDPKQRAAAIVAAQKEIVQSSINYYTANDLSVDQLTKQRATLDFTSKMLDIQNLDPAARIAAIKQLQNDPSYSEISDTLNSVLSSSFVAAGSSALTGTDQQKYSKALINYRLALDANPDDSNVQQAYNSYEKAMLGAISTEIDLNRETQFNEVQAADITQRPWWAQLISGSGVNIIEGLGGYADALAQVANEEDRHLVQEKVGVSVITNLRDKGYSWDDIQAASGDPISTARLLGLTDIDSTDADKRHQAAVMAANLQLGLQAGLNNPDVKKISSGTGGAFAFETGQSYADQSFLNIQGGPEKLATAIASQFTDDPVAIQATQKVINLATSVVDSFTSPLGIALVGTGAELGVASKWLTSAGVGGLTAETTVAATLGAIKIGGTIGALGDAYITPVFTAISKGGSAVANFVTSGSKFNPILFGDGELVTTAKATVASLEDDLAVAQKANNAEQVAQIQANLEEANTALTNAKAYENNFRVSNYWNSLSGKQATNVLGDIGTSLEGKIITTTDYAGATYRVAEQDSSAIILEQTSATEGAPSLIEITDPAEISKLTEFTTDANGVAKLDAATTDAVQAKAADLAADAAKGESSTAVANDINTADKTFNGPPKNSELTDTSDYEPSDTNVNKEVNARTQITGQLNKANGIAAKISKGDLEGALNDWTAAKANLQQASKQITKSVDNVLLQGKTGDDLFVSGLDGNTMKVLNNKGNIFGDNAIAKYNDAYVNSLKAQGIDTSNIVYGSEQKTITIDEKVVGGDENILLNAHDAAVSNVNDYLLNLRVQLEDGTIPMTTGKYGVSSIDDITGLDSFSAADVARNKATTAASLAEDKVPLTDTELSAISKTDAIKAEKLTIEKNALDAKQKYLSDSNLQSFSGTWDSDAKNFIVSLAKNDPDAAAYFIAPIPRGVPFDAAAFDATVSDSLSTVDTAFSDFQAGKITQEELGAVYQKEISPITTTIDEQSGGIHSVFNAKSGVSEVKGRPAFEYGLNQELATGQKGSVGIGDLNNIGFNNIKAASNAISELLKTNPEATAEELFIAANRGVQEGVNAEIIKGVNGAVSDINKFVDEGVADGTFTAADAEQIKSAKSISMLSGDEIGSYTPDKLATYLSSKGTSTGQIIRDSFESRTTLRASMGEADTVAGDTAETAMDAANQGLNLAKKTDIVPNKNSVVQVSEDRSIMTIVKTGDTDVLGKTYKATQVIQDNFNKRTLYEQITSAQQDFVNSVQPPAAVSP